MLGFTFRMRNKTFLNMGYEYFETIKWSSVSVESISYEITISTINELTFSFG